VEEWLKRFTYGIERKRARGRRGEICRLLHGIGDGIGERIGRGL
jgi:hypothetical protein